jgi:two-component system OmpR family response regulator
MSELRPRRGKVLVVDDDSVALTLASERLEEAGYEVVTRMQAIGTGSSMLRERPDFVLLDVRMPGLTGDRLAAILAQNRYLANVAIILHSGSDDTDLESLARRCGAVGAIRKTMDDQRFIAEFERLADRWRTSVKPDGTGGRGP